MWTDEAVPRAELLRRRGYTPFRYGVEMVRPHLDDIPDKPPPTGVDERPVEDTHLRAIWEAETEAFRDAWGYTERTEEEWNSWQDDPSRDPALWQVAWADDRMVGQVRTFIDTVENERFGRARGSTEYISTAREWRRMGIASSLICSSLRQLREVGMKEAGSGWTRRARPEPSVCIARWATCRPGPRAPTAVRCKASESGWGRRLL